jgi:hypothetical protein
MNLRTLASGLFIAALSANVAAAQDIGSSYGTTASNARTALRVPSVVTLCPSSDGSNTAVACASGGGGGTTNLTQVGGVTINLGQATMAASLPVAIASNQSTLPVAVSTAPDAIGLNAALGSLGSLPLQAVTTVTSPTYTAGNVSPLTGTTTGQLRVSSQGGAFVVSGGNSAALLQDSPTNALETEPFPTATATAALPGVSSTAPEASHVLKAAAGNLYSVYATATAAGVLMVVNAATPPTSPSAVTPIECVPVAANAEGSIVFPSVPESYSTGITALYSSTGCFTYTASATAFIHGNVK